MRFARLKTHQRFERLHLRGLSGARDEFHLAASVQKPQDAGPAPHRATATGCMRMGCVASVGGASVGTEAHMGEAKAQTRQEAPQRVGRRDASQSAAAPDLAAAGGHLNLGSGSVTYRGLLRART